MWNSVPIDLNHFRLVSFSISFTEAERELWQPIYKDDLDKLEASGWELYNLTEDFSESHNVASMKASRLPKTTKLPTNSQAN
jgi:hypothetical protein